MIPSGQWMGQDVSSTARTDIPANSASNIPSTAPNPKPNLQSCQFCRKRKIKCDKLDGGCSQCSRAQTECIYPASQRKGRPRKAGTSRPAPAPTPREAQLMKRVWKLEHAIANLTGRSGPGGVVGPVDNLTGVEESPRGQLGRLVIGKPYVNDTFWSNHLKDVLDDSDEESFDEDEDEDDYNIAPSDPADTYPANFIFDVDRSVDLTACHPHSSQIPLYWRLYQENCEVLLRMFHSPTTRKIVDQAEVDLSGLSRSNELLMFSIYFAVITSLSPEEVSLQLGADRAVLLSRYETAVRKALINSGFLNSQNLTVLQAFVLFLICIRHTDSAAVWTMTGLAIRIAHGMGIDRDGELFKLNPLEVELRRRVWHQISLLDLRTSEARGSFPTILVYDTRLPSNINDSDIGPEVRAYPEQRVGLTDMSGALLRLEVCEITRRLQKINSLAAKEKVLQEFQHHVETNYIQFCEGGGVFYRWCAKLGRLVSKRMILMLYKRENENDLSESTHEMLFLTSIDIIDLANQLRKDEYAKRWSWIVRTYTQWHALAVVLKELSKRPFTRETEHAWQVVNETDWDPAEDRASRLLSQSIKKLLAKAQAHRASQTMSTPPQQLSSPEEDNSVHGEQVFTTQGQYDPALLGQSFPPPPHFIHIPEHGTQPFYTPQILATQHPTQQQQVPNWYYDPNMPPPVDPNLPYVEYWTGWDPIKDYSLHGGTT